MSTSIKVLKTIKPPLRWVPVQREFTRGFLESKSQDPNGPTYADLTVGPDSVLQEAQRILGRCLPPTETGNPETGLVVGYVQSGKTLSFETVIALARDNGYGLVVVLAGTKNNLLDQSEDRLKKDFGIDDGDENWYHLHNPMASHKAQLDSRISAWRKKPTTKRAVLITVLKHGGWLEKLAKVLKSVNLVDVPSLIIDDESDQASLNTKAARIKAGLAAITDVSTTYKSILELRAVLPHHSYLQYTATPQAMLLMAQTDFLNPNFAELVTPGNAYTGGKSFFKANPGLIVDIPAAQVPTPTRVLSSPPKTLLEAFRSFLLVAAHHSLTRQKGPKPKDRNRSMMVHPAVATTSHKQYKAWLDRSLKTLKATVEKLQRTNPAAAEALFKSEYASLQATFPDIRDLPDLIDELVDEVFDELNVVEINGTKDAEEKVNWKATRYWVLVGGAKLDRGYTVEGLCTTYMPRPLGTSPAADTLQQRARFFGYKLPFLGLCRVYLQASVNAAFTEYIEHEEFVRSALATNRGKPLSNWRRDFILTELLKPTRPNVIGLGTRRIPVNGWLVPSAMQNDDKSAADNRKLLASVVPKWVQTYGKPVDAGTVLPGATSSPHDVIEGVSLSDVLEDFLLDVRVRDARDSEEHTAMLIALGTMRKKNPALKVDVFLMNRLQTGYRTRIAGHGLPAQHRYAPINQYFSQSAGTGVNDRDHCFVDRISLQLRRFDLGTQQRTQATADVNDVTWFALNVPSQMRKALLIEERS